MNVDDYSLSESESESETSENQESATTSTVTSTSCPSPKKRKRPKQTQSFVDSWLTEQQFSGWLTKRHIQFKIFLWLCTLALDISCSRISS